MESRVVTRARRKKVTAPAAPARAVAAVAVGVALRRSFASSPRLSVDNRSGYDTRDLHAFFLAGLRSMGVAGKKRVVVVASPIYSRGCATIGGETIVIAIAAPSRFSWRRLARLFEHEATHSTGKDHHEMSERDLYSEGPCPRWAKPWALGSRKLRYRGRARGQL